MFYETMLVRGRGGRTRAECFTAMRNNNLSGKLSSIRTPILFIWGAEDNTVPLRDAGVVAEEMFDADLRILPNAGHWPQFEAKTNCSKICCFIPWCASF